MQLHESQNIVASDTHRFRVLDCGRRWGKTTLAIEEIKGKAISKPSRIVYIAPTYQQARDIAWGTLKAELEPVAISINESRLEITVQTIQGGQSIIILRAWEAVETLRGQYFDFMVIDEVASMKHFWTGWNEVLSPTLVDRKGDALFISTPKGFNHFYELYSKDPERPPAKDMTQDADYKSFHFTTYDNPFIPREEIERERASKPEDTFAQEFLADFRRMEGLVYKEFDRDKHLYSTRGNVNIIERIVGLDFGYTNPTAMVVIEKDTDNHYWVVDEYYKTGKTTPEITQYLGTLKANKVYPDPAEPDRIEELRRAKVNVQDVSKDVEAGISAVRELFKTDRLHISTNCTNLIAELEMYRYPERKPDKNEPEAPVKEYDHACFTKDAIINLPLGSVICRQSTGIKDVYEFMGSKVTADHPYLTPRGFVRLDSLRYSDKIAIWRNKLLTELSLDDTQTQNAVSLKTILYLLQRNCLAVKLNVSTGIYGRNIMAQFLKGGISITKTVITLITTYLISNWYHQKNTFINTIKRTYLGGERELRKLSLRLVNGLTPEKVKFSGTTKERTTPNISPVTRLKEIVIGVVKSMLPRQTLVNSATIIAKLKHCGKEEVFAVSTSSGFFTANGVVVSNCDALRYALYMQNSINPDQRAKQFYPTSVIQVKTKLEKPWEKQWIDRPNSWYN